jgi:hypothetical protein
VNDGQVSNNSQLSASNKKNTRYWRLDSDSTGQDGTVM